MTVRARAPLRLGLAGGGTDVPPFCDLHGGLVLNATIEKYAYAHIEELNERRIEFVASDRNEAVSYDLVECIPLDGNLDLHKGVYNRIIRDYNGGKPLQIRVTTYAEAPAGSGLGSSSTLVVAMVKGFVELLNLPLGEYEIASLAYQIEREDVGLNGGKQDQYAATFGGFNFIEFCDEDRVIVNPLRVKNWIISELEASLVLFYTGVSRESAAIIDEQSQSVRNGAERSIAAMKELKKNAIDMKESILKGDFPRFAESLGATWETKKKMASQITNEHIEEVYDAAINAGALSGKVSGAGGGGFMMFFVDPVHRAAVINALEGKGGRIFGCHFTKHGTQGWRI